MATIKERLSEAMKTAMKAKDKDTLQFARNLHGAVRKKEIDEKSDLDDGGIQKIISSMMKQRQDSIEQFKKGGREDLVQAEEAELKFLLSFMPEQMKDEDILKIVDAAIQEVQPSGPKDMGKVMKIVVPKTQGRADGKKVSQFVRERLT